MARFAIAFLSLIIVATPCVAGLQYFRVSGDQAGTVCALTDIGAGTLVSVYVWHMGGGATGSRFGISPPVGATWAFVGFQNPFGQIPASSTDIALGYGRCIDADTYIGVASWISIVAAPTCSNIAVWPNTITDCAFVEYTGIFSQPMIVNSITGCPCYTATEPATWGSIKALYR